MKLYFYFRRQQHALARREVIDNLFLMLHGRESAESGYGDTVELGACVAQHYGQTLDKSVDIGSRASGKLR